MSYMRPDPGGAAYIYHHRCRDRPPDRSRQPPARSALGCQRRQEHHIARRADDFAGGGEYRNRLNSSVTADTNQNAWDDTIYMAGL